MLILPERGVPRAKLLLPVHDREWRASSQAQQKDEFGNENCTRFCVEQRGHDGHIVWRGYFDDRADFDQFLWAVANETLIYDRYVQRLATPWWNPEYWDLPFAFATLRFLTTTNAANQTDTVPSDWNSFNNFIDTIASGGSGGVVSGGGSATGGSGPGWSRQTNVSLTKGGSATYRLPAGGAAVSSSSGLVAGNAGADCWYNGTTLAGSSVGAKGGLGGSGNTTIGAASGVAGGAAGSGVGSSKNSGGASGNTNRTGTPSASGGGAAAGPNGNGNASAAANDAQTAGGSGDAGSGGAGGAINGGAAGAGTEFDATHGSGGGGGPNASSIAGVTAGSGGLYGGAGGGAVGLNASTSTSGAGRQALIYQNYTPVFAPAFRRSTRFFTRSF